jgi:hypothetical protein
MPSTCQGQSPMILLYPVMLSMVMQTVGCRNVSVGTAMVGGHAVA